MSNNQSYHNIMTSSNYDIESKGNRIHLPRMNTVVSGLHEEPLRAVSFRPQQTQVQQIQEQPNNYILRKYEDNIRNITQDFIESRSFTNLLLILILMLFIFIIVVVLSNL